MNKYIFLVISMVFFLQKASAIDFISDGKINSQISIGYKIKSGDTIGGYPIFQTDGDWFLYYSDILKTTGGTGPLKQPIVGLSMYQGGKWLMSQMVTVTIEQSGGMGGWIGDPCAGDKIVKINFNRGSVDRCAAAEIENMRVAGSLIDTLKITFVESNTGGRVYKSTFNVGFENMGFTYSTVTDRSSDFNKNLREWMGKYLDGAVKAAGYDKPANAFQDVPNFANAVGNPYVAKSSSSKVAEKQNVNNQNIQDRLRKLKELFDGNLITSEDYEKKRTEILNSL